MSRYRPGRLCPLQILGIALLVAAVPLLLLAAPFGPGPFSVPVRHAALLPMDPLIPPVEETFQSANRGISRIGVYFATGLPQNAGLVTVQVSAWEPPQGWVPVGSRRFPPGAIGNNSYGEVTLQPNGASRYRLRLTGLGTGSATTVWTVPVTVAEEAGAGSFPPVTMGGRPFPGTLPLRLEWTGQPVPLGNALFRSLLRAGQRASRAWALEVPASGVLALAGGLLAGLAGLVLSLLCGRL